MDKANAKIEQENNSKSTWKWFGGTEVLGSLSLLGTLMSTKFVDKCYFYLNLFVATVICSHELMCCAFKNISSKYSWPLVGYS